MQSGCAATTAAGKAQSLPGFCVVLLFIPKPSAMRKSNFITEMLFVAVIVMVVGASVFIYDDDAQPADVERPLKSNIEATRPENQSSCTPGCHESMVAEKKSIRKPVPVKGSRIFNTSPQLVGKWFKTRSEVPDEPVL
jgi:hypothetical protein